MRESAWENLDDSVDLSIRSHEPDKGGDGSPEALIESKSR